MRRHAVVAVAVIVLLATVGTALAQGELWVDRVEERGRLLVPIRGIFESFGATVNWDGQMREISIASGNNQVVMYVNDYIAYINGNSYRLDVPPRVIRGRTYVPLRFAGEALGGTVEYRGSYVDMTENATGYLLRVHLQRRGGGGPSGGGGQAGSGYIATWTSNRRVTDNDLRGYGNWQLTLMRNEIYARKGRPFDNANIRAYFNRQPWYRPDRSFTESRLTNLENANAAHIRNYQVRVYGAPASSP